MRPSDTGAASAADAIRPLEGIRRRRGGDGHGVPLCTRSITGETSAHTRGCGRSLPGAKPGRVPVGQVVLEGVLEVPPEVPPWDGAHPAPREPRPIPPPARTPFTWSVIRWVRVLFIVSA